MKKYISILILGMTLAFTACGGTAADTGNENEVVKEETIEVNHMDGTTTVPLNPKKLVVMDFGSLDTINDLGVDVELAIPANNLPSYLSKYEDEKYLNIGGLKEYDLEAVHGFQPDLIILGARQRDAYADFSEIAPTIVLSPDNEAYLDSSINNIKTLGDIFNKEEEVNEKIDLLKEKIELINEFTKDNPAKTLILLTNEGNISVYGSGSRFGIIHDDFGFTEADSTIEVSTHGQEVNYEYISKINPDYIFVVDRTAAIGGDIKANESLNNDLVNSTDAAKNDKIIILNPDIWYLSGGGLESLNSMADEVYDAVK